MLLLKKLKISLLSNNLHFIFFFLILLILSIYKWYYFFILLIFLIFLIRKTKLFIFIIVISLFTIISYCQYHNKIADNFYGIIVEKNADKYTIRTKKGKVLCYSNLELEIGDYGYFETEEVNYDSSLFNYSTYLENNNILRLCKIESFRKKDNYFTFSKIKYILMNITDTNNSLIDNYIHTLIYGYKSLDSKIMENSRKIGISHLLSISGMHVSLFLYLLKLVLDKIFRFERPKNIFLLSFMLFYLILTDFQIPISRAILMHSFMILFKNKKYKFSSLDYLSISGIIMLLFHPKFLFLLSFQLSFLVSFYIIVFVKQFKINNKIINLLCLSLVSFIVTLPIIIKSNYEINLLSIIINPFFCLYFEFILFPISLIILFFPFLANYLSLFYSFFSKAIFVIAKIDNLTFTFGSINTLEFILFLVLSFMLLSSFEVKGKRLFYSNLYLIFLLFLYYRPSLNPFYKVVFYDVGQGDSFLISLPHNQGNVLIDCYNNIDLYLKKDAVRKIDYLFLTHGHLDHVDKFEELNQKYNFKKIYISKFDNTKLIKDLKRKYKMTSIKGGDVINIHNLSFVCLSPIKEYQEENNNSLVIKVAIEKYSFLFTADIESKVEMDLIEKYQNELKTDIIKVAHHGSKNSSTDLFLKYVNPKYYIISVGKNNRYNLPDNLSLLKKDNLYRTDINGSIYIYIRKNIFLLVKNMIKY